MKQLPKGFYIIKNSHTHRSKGWGIVNGTLRDIFMSTDDYHISTLDDFNSALKQSQGWLLVFDEDADNYVGLIHSKNRHVEPSSVISHILAESPKIGYNKKGQLINQKKYSFLNLDYQEGIEIIK